MTPPARFDIGAAARGYGIDVVDYGNHRGGGLLVHNGTGLALAVMDALPELRWVADFSGLRSPVPTRLGWFLDCAAQMSTLIVAALMFSTDEPHAAREMLQHVDVGWLLVMSNLDLGLGCRVRDFEQLAEQARLKARNAYSPGFA